MGWRKTFLDRYYYSLPNWRDGTTRFHEFIRNATCCEDTCLEIGAGPSNPTSHFLAGHFQNVDGIDIDPDVRNNSSLRQTHVYNGCAFPIDDGGYDCAIANYALEHVEKPEIFLAEILRILKPGGCFVFRTPNQWHYVSIAARLIPNRFHHSIASRARNMPADAHEAYPTFHRMNARRQLRRLANRTGFAEVSLEVFEFEPSYMVFHPAAFWLGVLYERIVNRFGLLSGLRANIFGVMRKPDVEACPEDAIAVRSKNAA